MRGARVGTVLRALLQATTADGHVLHPCNLFHLSQEADPKRNCRQREQAAVRLGHLLAKTSHDLDGGGDGPEGEPVEEGAEAGLEVRVELQQPGQLRRLRVGALPVDLPFVAAFADAVAGAVNAAAAGVFVAIAVVQTVPHVSVPGP